MTETGRENQRKLGMVKVPYRVNRVFIPFLNISKQYLTCLLHLKSYLREVTTQAFDNVF